MRYQFKLKLSMDYKLHIFILFALVLPMTFASSTFDEQQNKEMQLINSYLSTPLPTPVATPSAQIPGVENTSILTELDNLDESSKVEPTPTPTADNTAPEPEEDLFDSVNISNSGLAKIKTEEKKNRIRIRSR